MTETDFRRANHYVPCEYLKRWESSAGRVWVYRILVSDEKVPLWKEKSIRGIAYHTHLYTRLAVCGETDEIERWFECEYETPAADVLKKVTSNARLTPSDWKVLIRFLAAQDVRTPARLVENLQRWHITLPSLLQNTVEEAVRNFESMKARGEKLPSIKSPSAENFSLRIETEIVPDQELVAIKAKTIVGRELWLFGIKHLLSKTADVLHQHKWTILSPPKGMTWFTSDDPVVRLNYRSPENYNFGGGWGSEGTDIFMPLSPNHLLYTQVGRRPPPRDTQISLAQAQIMRRCIAEHAHRFIFASEPEAQVPKLKPRMVSADLLQDEKIKWSKWHEDQAAAEKS